MNIRLMHKKLKDILCYDVENAMRGLFFMRSADRIKELRENTGQTRKEFSEHTGIPVRTLEDWEAGRRTPPEYIPRLISYQLKYEELLRKISTQGMNDDNLERGDGGFERS